MSLPKFTAAHPLAMLIKHRQLWCVLLCVLSWRGPVPVLHCHAGDAEADNIHLVEHLNAYHPSHDTADDWHLHVMLMSDLVAGSCDDDEGEPATEPPLVCGTSGSLANLGLAFASVAEPVFAGDAVQPRCCGGSLHRQLPSIAGNSFLTSQLAARPLCAVLCIARC